MADTIDRRSTELHGQTDLRLEIMNYILNVINILVYINSASSISKVAGSKPSRGKEYLSACARSGNYEIHTREHSYHITDLNNNTTQHNTTQHNTT
jgi:hypothetical protein